MFLIFSENPSKTLPEIECSNELVNLGRLRSYKDMNDDEL